LAGRRIRHAQRTPLYLACRRLFHRQKPWLGYGYEAFWNPTRVETISEEVGWGPRSPNGLSGCCSLGGLGLAALLLSVLAGLIAAIRGCVKLRDPCYALPLGMLVFGLLVSFMESGMVIVEFATVLTAACLLRMAFFEDSPPSASDN
jgi:hypothetical protein